MEFKNNVAFVTGGTRGIGRAIALELANHGCHIAFNYRSSETQAQTLVSELKRRDVKLTVIARIFQI